MWSLLRWAVGWWRTRVLGRQKRKKELPAPVAAVIVVCAIVLAPVLLPIAMLQMKREKRRCRAVARSMCCVSCGELLGEQALVHARALWAAHVAQIRAEYPHVMYRLARPYDAVCTVCQQVYHWQDSAGVLEPVPSV